jgi:hypothetical protein
MIYIFPWPLAIVICVLMLCVAFVSAVAVGSKSGLARLTTENRLLRAAINDFLAAQDQPPGNWDAIDRLRAAVGK